MPRLCHQMMEVKWYSREELRAALANSLLEENPFAGALLHCAPVPAGCANLNGIQAVPQLHVRVPSRLCVSARRRRRQQRSAAIVLAAALCDRAPPRQGLGQQGVFGLRRPAVATPSQADGARGLLPSPHTHDRGHPPSSDGAMRNVSGASIPSRHQAGYGLPTRWHRLHQKKGASDSALSHLRRPLLDGVPRWTSSSCGDGAANELASLVIAHPLKGVCAVWYATDRALVIQL